MRELETKKREAESRADSAELKVRVLEFQQFSLFTSI